MGQFAHLVHIHERQFGRVAVRVQIDLPGLKPSPGRGHFGRREAKRDAAPDGFPLLAMRGLVGGEQGGMQRGGKGRLILYLEKALVENGVQAAGERDRAVAELFQHRQIAVENAVVRIVDLPALFQIGVRNGRADQMIGHGVGRDLRAEDCAPRTQLMNRRAGYDLPRAGPPDQQHVLARQQGQFELLDAVVVADQMFFERVQSARKGGIAHLLLRCNSHNGYK